MKNNTIICNKVEYNSNFNANENTVIENSTVHINLNNIVELDLMELKNRKNENLIILQYELENNCSKSTVLYQLIFCFELYLKYKLALSSIVTTFKELMIYGHKIDDMVNDLVENTNNQIFEDIKTMIKKIRINGERKINLIRYVDFKYNMDENSIVFTDNILTEKEKMISKEVIKCIEN